VDYVCIDCNFTFKEETLLKNHINNTHEKSSHDNIQPKQKESEEKEKSETSFLCEQCSQSFKTLIECQEHVNSHPFKCYKCKFESKCQEEVEKHEKKEHSLPTDDSVEKNKLNVISVSTSPTTKIPSKSIHQVTMELFTAANASIAPLIRIL
jgi:hypothetical protein